MKVYAYTAKPPESPADQAAKRRQIARVLQQTRATDEDIEVAKGMVRGMRGK
jgi:hypothetical protein